MKLLYIFLLLLVAISGVANGNNSSSVEIIQPLDKTRYIGEHSTFVFQTATSVSTTNSTQKIDKIVISQDNNITTTIDVNSTKKTYCKTIKLKFGINNILVDIYSLGTLVNKYERKLYYLSELSEEYNEDESEEYNINHFHTDKKENECKSCHNMTSNIPTNDEVFEDVSKTTCYNCHKNVMSSRNTHAPTANWLCTSCHDGNFGEYNVNQEGTSKYLAPNPISKTCTSCHEKVEKWTMSKYTHGPVNDGRCNRCHNPHGSENEFFLRKKIWDICTTCHAEKASGKHVVSSFVFGRNQGAHPTKGRRDPSRPDRELTCSSCHNPHGSSGVFLLRMKGSMSFNVCSRCHKK